MPLKLHRKLNKRAKKLKLNKKRKGAYIYGTLSKIKKRKKAKK